MQSITTKYLGPTNYRGSRIKAITESGISVIVSYDDGLDSYANHEAAAKKLYAKLNWHGNIIAGGTKDGYVFVFANGDRFTV